MKFSTIKDKLSKKNTGVNPRVLVFMLATAIVGMATPFFETQSVAWMIGLVSVMISGFTMFYVLHKVLSDENGKLFF